MRNVIITETELELIHSVLNDWFRFRFFVPDCMSKEDYHKVLGLCHSLPECNKDMVCEY